LIADLEKRDRVHSQDDPTRYARLHHWDRTPEGRSR
jgi:hypothetical protein